MGKAQYVSTLPRCSYNCTHIKTVLCGAGRRGEAAKRRRRFCSVYGEVVLWGHQAARPIFPHAPGAEVAVYLVSFMPLPLLGMLDDELFGALNGVMLGWAALAFLPRWRHTPAVTLGFVVLYSAMYAVLLLQRALAAPLPEGAGFGSLEAVVALFSDRDVVFAGWTHYIAFDLFVGRHIILDSQRTGLPHLAVLPLLPLTLMAGPAGLALYTGLKSAWSRWPRGYNPLPPRSPVPAHAAVCSMGRHRSHSAQPNPAAELQGLPSRGGMGLPDHRAGADHPQLHTPNEHGTTTWVVVRAQSCR
jgi:hypothetical protein